MSEFSGYRGRRPTRLSPYVRRDVPPLWRRLFGWFCLFGALGLCVGAVLLVVTAPSAVSDAALEPNTDSTPTQTRLPETVSAVQAPVETSSEGAMARPTLSAADIAALLATPPEVGDIAARSAGRYDPFTTITNRARSEMTTYLAQRGDTINGIANRYGLKRETIAWCNDYRLAQVLRPGDIVTIPPADGACHTVLRTQGKDIRDIAAQYGVEDPYAIIDAPANNLADVSPETLLPSNFFVFIPGGEGQVITWDAPVQQDSAGNVVAFDPGSRFSCGSRPGGGTVWTNPLPNGAYVRGFYAGHSGIDIAAPIGTPIYAANGGPILYAGWNNWGYGSTVVIGHGAWSTLYGHMSSIGVRCGQTVAAGQVIGYVGSSGNSSGPHLHFEVRYRNRPADPSATAGIGW